MVRRSMYNFPPPSRNSMASSVCSSSNGSSKGSRMSDFAAGGRRTSALFMSARSRSRPRSAAMTAMQMRPTSTGCESVGELVSLPDRPMDSFELPPLFELLNGVDLFVTLTAGRNGEL